MKVFQQLNINLNYKENVKDLFNKGKIIRKTVRMPRNTTTTITNKTRMSMKSTISSK